MKGGGFTSTVKDIQVSTGGGSFSLLFCIMLAGSGFFCRPSQWQTEGNGE